MKLCQEFIQFSDSDHQTSKNIQFNKTHKLVSGQRVMIYALSSATIKSKLNVTKLLGTVILNLKCG